MTYFGIALIILGIFALAGIIYVQLDRKHLKTKENSRIIDSRAKTLRKNNKNLFLSASLRLCARITKTQTPPKPANDPQPLPESPQPTPP